MSPLSLNLLTQGWAFLIISGRFFFPAQMLSIYKSLVCPCMVYASRVWGGLHTNSPFGHSGERIANFHPLSDCAIMLYLFLSSTDTFMLNALLNLLTVCLYYFHSHSPPPLNFILLLTPILSRPFIQEINSIFVLLSLKMGTHYPAWPIQPAQTGQG